MAALILAARLFLGLLFVSAGLAKLSRRAEFRERVADYRILADRLVGPAALAVPILELAGGVLLILGVATSVASAATALLLLAFAAAIVVNLRRGRDIACGCYGASDDDRISWWQVARNLALTVVAVGVAALASSAGSVPAADWVAVGIVVAGFVAVARLGGYAVRIRQALAHVPTSTNLRETAT